MTTLYCARWVLPDAESPIEDGAVVVEGSRVVGVGRRSEVSPQHAEAEVRDFGEAVILPGFVNTHSHLELTAMRGYLEREEVDFFSWLRKLTSARLEMTPDDLYVSATWGAVEAARAGVTCMGDASDAATSSMRALCDVGLRGIVYQESFGPDPAAATQNFEILREKVLRLRALETEEVRAGVSPHSAYTVSAPQLHLITEFALAEKLPLMMHAAESEAEARLLHDGSGPFGENLSRRGISWNAPGTSTIRYLASVGVLHAKPLLAHCITVDEEDIDLIKETDSRIAHCPKSNAKLGHARAPIARFVDKKIKVGFGSDSVASNNTCDMLEEARFALLMARASQSKSREGHWLGAKTGLEMLTRGGSRALGLEAKAGILVEGGPADIAIVGLDGAHQIPVHDLSAALGFASSGRDVLLTMVAGKVVYEDGRVQTVDEERLRVRMMEIAKALGGEQRPK